MKDHMDSIEPLKAYYDYRGDALSGTAPILEYTEWLEQRYIDHHRFALQWQSNYSGLNERFAEIKAERNIARARGKELTENFNKQNVEVQGLRSNLSYEKQTNKIIGAKLETLEKAEAVWIREASLLREALNKATDAVIESEAKAERYYRKMVQDARDARDEVDKMSQRLFETRSALHNLVEACHRADNEGELAGEIDGELMDEAWRVLK